MSDADFRLVASAFAFFSVSPFVAASIAARARTSSGESCSSSTSCSAFLPLLAVSDTRMPFVLMSDMREIRMPPTTSPPNFTFGSQYSSMDLPIHCVAVVAPRQ
jgi:hypothetical protein